MSEKEEEKNPPQHTEFEATEADGARASDTEKPDSVSTEPVTLEASNGEEPENTGGEENADVPADDVSPTVSKPKPRSRPKSETNKKSGRTGFYFLLILIIAACGAAAYGAFWFWDQFNSSEQLRSTSIDELKQQLESQRQSISAIENAQREVADSLREQLAQTQQRLQAAEQRLTAQNKRLLSMSTISREDWLLAEAEYLLKLANQRVLIERSAEGADALLSEADAILRDLEDPDLFPLRQAIANDLAELRLVKEIDVEGIYLTLEALASRVEDLPLRPTREQLLGGDNAEDAAVDADGNPMEPGWWSKIKSNFSRFFGDTGRYIRVRDHSIKPRPMLPPDSEQYLQQNLRLILQRAQLALLREQQKIYTDSLQQAREWVARYYPPSEQARKFQRQIETLEGREIARQLPDITESLELVHAYIDRLHKLDGAEPAAESSGDQR